MIPSNAKIPIVATVISVCVVLFASESRAQQPGVEAAKPSAPSGIISGRVVSSSGDPLTNAVVYVSTIGISAPPRSAIVNSDGSFKMDGLEVGAYFVWANAPGFNSDAPVSPLGPRRFYHTGDSVNLTLTKGGVITGTVTNNTDTPVVAASVHAFRIRDENGKPIEGLIQFRDRMTDDRGFYRIYGLQPGTYVVSAGGSARFYGGLGTTLYDNDVPTYAPSSTRDTAMEVSVRSGEEITVDIQYRGEPGHAISGSVAGITQTQATISYNSTISLTDVRTRAMLMNTPATLFNNYSFAFYGLADGEYEVLAQQYSQSGDGRMSEPRRIKVQGADITGVNLNLAPLPSIAGRIVLESNPPADCIKRRATASQETVISARRWNQEAKAAAAKPARPAPGDEIPLAYVNQNADAVPDAKGDFILRNLHTGSYRLNVQLPSAGWYLRSMAVGSAARASDASIAGDGIILKASQSVSGVIVTITEGAASLRGRVSAAEGQRLPPDLCIYLVPAERDNVENVLRVFEARAEDGGSFAVGNIAPGRYWIIARLPDDNDPTKTKPSREDSVLRARIFREAEALKKEISFTPCERTGDYDLPYAPGPAPKQ